MKTQNKKPALFTILFFMFLLTACGGTGKSTDDQNTSKPDTLSSPETAAASEPDAEDNVFSYLPLSEGAAAPDFTAALTDGTTFTLSEQQGKVVLLNFWATWCGPCVREMPAFEKLKEEYGENAVILAVNCMESEDIVKAFQEENGYTFPIACDPEGDIVLKYPSQGIPYTLVIDAEGIIQKIYVGAADADTQYLEYKNAIDAVSGEE